MLSLGKLVPSKDTTKSHTLSTDDCLEGLEKLQEQYIFRQIRRCLKPFRIFMSLIGRFPYTIHTTKKAKHNRTKYPRKLQKLSRFSKDSLKHLIKTESPIPDCCNTSEDADKFKKFDSDFLHQNEEGYSDEHEYCYVYNEFSFRTAFYCTITILTLFAIGRYDLLLPPFYVKMHEFVP